MTDQFGKLRRTGLQAVTDPLVDHEKRLKRLEGLSPDQLGGTRQRIVVVDEKADAAQAEALAAREESLQAQADALSAATDALAAQVASAQAVLDAAAAAQQTVNLRESIAQPGVNKFDTAPIVAQNINGYTAVNLTGYSWITNGIRLQTPESTGVGVNLFTLDTFSVRPGDVLSASVTLQFDNPAIAGFGWSFFTADGTPISSSAASNASVNGLMQSQYKVPSGAASLRMNLYAYVPNGYPITRTWVNFTNPYVGILVGSDGLAKEAVKRINIAPGAVGANELDPGLEFGVPDNSLTTAKYQDNSVTDAKIVGMALSKGTGTIATAQVADNAVARAKLSTEVRARIKTNGGFSRVGNDTQVYSNIATGTWTPFITGPATGVTIVNALNDGNAGTITSGYVVAPETGWYDFSIQFRFGTSAAGTARSIAIRLGTAGANQMENGIRANSGQIPSPGSLVVISSGLIYAQAGDQFQPVARQDSGGALGVRLDTVTLKYFGP